MSPRDSEDDLLRRALEGDPDARSQLLKLCLPRIHQGALRGLGPHRAPEDREEVVQRALIALLEALPRFRGDASIHTFAFRIGFLQGRQYIENDWRCRPVDPIEPGSPLTSREASDPGPDRQAASRDLARRLLEQLAASLSVREQLVLKYHFVDDLDAAEIAHLMNLEVNNVYQIIHRIRTLARSIRSKLSDDD